MVARDMFGRSISKEKSKTQIMNISLTSYGGMVEEKSQHDDNSPVASTKSYMKGNIKQPSNLLNELVYEIISDGDQEKRP
jgi:hypothetical protein